MLTKNKLDELIKGILNIQCREFGIDYDGNFLEYIKFISSAYLRAHQVELLNEYNDLIEQKTRGAITDYKYQDAAMNYLRGQLLKAYKFRYKYDNWNRVVKSIINRRLIDYKKKIYKYNRIVTNSGLFNNDDEYLDYYDIDKVSMQSKTIENADELEYLIRLIHDNKDKFFDVEYEYINTLITMYENGFDPMDNKKVYDFMGYVKDNSEDKKQFNKIRHRTIKKIRALYGDYY